MIEKMIKLSLQNRIAFYIIISMAILVMVLCTVILIVFKLHTDNLDATNITLGEVKNLFFILLQVCCSGCFITLILLFIISRKIAQKSTKPI